MTIVFMSSGDARVAPQIPDHANEPKRRNAAIPRRAARRDHPAVDCYTVPVARGPVVREGAPRARAGLAPCCRVAAAKDALERR